MRLGGLPHEKLQGTGHLMYLDCMRISERITVNLIHDASEALALAQRLTSLSKTDTVNRALQMYAYLMQAKKDGKAFYIKDGKGRFEKIEFL